MIGWGHDNITGLDYWTARNSWSDNWGEDHLNPMANCSNGECGFFRITRDYTDPVTNRTHNSCQMNWHAVAGLAEIPGSCAACNSAQRPDDTDYCRCAMASAGKMPTCAVSGRPCVACCLPALKSDDEDVRYESTDGSAIEVPKCTCPNASLCQPLPHGPPVSDVHVWSDCSVGDGDCAGQCLNLTDPYCKQTSSWAQFDLSVVTTLAMMHGAHSVTVSVDGAVRVNNGLLDLSTLLCTAHAHDVRVLAVVRPDLLSDPTKMFYRNLFGNATAVSRMANELTAMVGASGIDGLEFDFEEMTGEMINQANTTSFDFGGHHVAAMTQVSHTLKTAHPHATVALAVDAVDLTPPLTAHVRTYAQMYPVARLSKAVDQIFVMAYDLWPDGQQCAGPNSPLPEVKKSVQSYIKSGADPSSLVLGLGWYGYEYRCNSSLTPTSSSTSAPCKVSGLGSPRCLTGTRANPLVEYLGVSAWAMEAMLAEGCTKGWSDEFASAFLNCPVSTGPWQNASSTWPGDHLIPYGKGNCWERPSKGCDAVPKWSQTWYDDAKATKAKVTVAKALKLGGVGVFTGEGAGIGPSAAEYWAALGSINV